MSLFAPEIQLWVGTDTGGDYLPCNRAVDYLSARLTETGRRKFDDLMRSAAASIRTGYVVGPRLEHVEPHADERPVARLVMLVHLAHEAVAAKIPNYRQPVYAGDLYSFACAPLAPSMPDFFRFVQQHCFDSEASREFLGQRRWLLDAHGLSLRAENPAFARAAAEMRLSASGWKAMGKELVRARLWREENWRHGNFFKNFRDGYAAIVATLARRPEYTADDPLIVTDAPIKEARALAAAYPQIVTAQVLRSHIIEAGAVLDVQDLKAQLPKPAALLPDYLNPHHVTAVITRIKEIRRDPGVYLADYRSGAVMHLSRAGARAYLEETLSAAQLARCEARSRTVTNDDFVRQALQEDEIDRRILAARLPEFPDAASLRHTRRLPFADFARFFAVNALCSPVSPEAQSDAPSLSVHRNPALLSRELACLPPGEKTNRMRARLAAVMERIQKELPVQDKDAIALQVAFARLSATPQETHLTRNRMPLSSPRHPETPGSRELFAALRELASLPAYTRGRTPQQITGSIGDLLKQSGLKAPEKLSSYLGPQARKTKDPACDPER